MSTAPIPLDAYWLRRSQAVYEWFARTFLASGSSRVIDLGCAHGFGAAILAAAGADVVGVDRSPASITAARLRFRSPRLRYEVADARRVPEPNGSFDAVIASGLVERVPDPRRLIAEAHRLVKPAGTIVLVTPNRLTSSPGRTRPVNGEHHWEFTPDELYGLVSHATGREARMLGLFHGRRLRAVEAALGASLAGTMRRLAPVDRGIWLRTAMLGLSGGDFKVGPGVVREALDLVASA